MTRRPHVVRHPLALLVPFAVAGAALPACDGCHAGKPYTPYTLSDTSAGSAGGHVAAPPAGEGAGGASAFTPVAGVAAPGDGKTWALEGGAVEPPAGHVFSVGLVFDADGDGKSDLVAWAHAPDGLRGELWFAAGKNPAAGSLVAALPADVAEAGCSPTSALTRIGASLIVLDVDPHCGARARRRGSRWIAIFRLGSTGAPELGLELRAAAPADGEMLAVVLDGRDRDGDGRSDVTATIALTGAPHPLAEGGAAATLAFFDRPAGLSRDPSEPEASLRALGASLVAEGRKKSTAARVQAAAGAAVRLHALLCEEGGKPAITTSAGSVRCGDVRLLEEAAMAETEAALNLGDPFAAMAALVRVEPRRKDLDGLVAKSIPSIAGRLVRTTAAAPDVSSAPSFGPVAILPGGDVLVRTRDKIVKVDRVSFEETRVEAALRWSSPLAPLADPPAWTLASVEERCDAPTLVARFASGTDTTDVPLPVLARPRCTGTTRVPIDALGTAKQGVLVGVRGEIVAIPTAAPPHPVLADALAAPPGGTPELGAARSPNGAVVALSVPRGVLVATLDGPARGAKAKLWTTPALDAATACVPNDAADRIACVVKGAVAIYDAK
jgi:hypothetical protein